MRAPGAVGAFLLVALAGAAAFASDAIDSEVNPQNNYVETVKSELVSGGYDIHLYIAPGLNETPTVLDVSAHPSDDKSPRIEIAPTGDAWLTWWRELPTDEVRIRKLSYASQTFGSDRIVSQPGENARNPEIVFDGANPWVVYEVHGTSHSVIVSIIVDEPDPVPTGVTLRTTPYSGTMDVRIHSDSGHLWVTWVDSPTNVGWSEYSYQGGTWSSASYQSYSGSTVSAARATIRGIVLGQ